MSYVVSTDCGGTFVDAVILDSSGALHVGKAPTTPDRPSVGVLGAVQAAAAGAGKGLGDVLKYCELFLNGTTVTTNAMVQGSGAKAGLIITRGFEDTMIIGRTKARWVGLSEAELLDFKKVERPAPVVPRNLIRGVAERIDCFGKVIVPLDPVEVERAVDDLVREGVESLAVCLLWSFKNPAHEEAITAIARRKHPSLYVVASSELVSAMGEYERANTAAVDARLGPTLKSYLSDIRDALSKAHYGGEVLVMQSIGGLAPASGFEHAAVSTLHSGPVGGIIAAQKLGETIGHGNIITADMGGTTFDVGLVVDGKPVKSQVSIMERNLLMVPAVEAISIGAGGGSVAWLDAAGALHVGPKSQSARPGPACYDRGGELATVTDADVVLGYINPDTFLGGSMPLRKDLARRAVRRFVADPLGASIEAAAQAVYEIVNAHMADLVRNVSVGRGHDPRDFTMVAFGGCGPTHATGFGPECEVRDVVVPPAATVFSALGIAQSDIKHFFARTYVKSIDPSAPLDTALCAELTTLFDQLHDRATRQFDRDGVPPGRRAIVRGIDIRYRKQVHELTIPLTVSGPVTEASVRSILQDFHQAYEKLYGAGSSMSAATVEIVTIRLDAVARMAFEYLPRKSKLGDRSPKAAFLGEREVWWKAAGGFHKTPTYQLERLQPGNALTGPAVIESYGTSIPLHPGQHARMDEWGNLLLAFPVEGEAERSIASTSTVVRTQA